MLLRYSVFDYKHLFHSLEGCRSCAVTVESSAADAVHAIAIEAAAVAVCSTTTKSRSRGLTVER